MKVKDLGERKILEKIIKGFPSHLLGDDCTPIPFGDYYLLTTVDGIHEDTDIPPGMTYYEAGWYSCASTLSDIAAKGGLPISVLTSVFLPEDFEVESLLSFLRGVDECASLFGAKLDGGDINFGEKFSAGVFALGLTDKDSYVSRSGARPGDVIIVTGTFGTPSGVLKKILSGENVPDKLREKLMRPRPRVWEGMVLTSLGIITASIDSSDGLYESLRTISEESEVALVVDYDSIPKDEWLTSNFPPEEVFSHVFFGGGEYELVMTSKREILDKIEEIREDLGVDITIVGEVEEGRGVFVKRDGKIEEVKGRGWEHFRGR